LPASILTQLNRSFPASNRLKNAKSVHRNSVDGKLDVLKGREKHQESAGSSSSASEPDQDEVFDYDRQEEVEEHGQTILATALDKAVVKFEDKQTSMLIRNEYVMVREFIHAAPKLTSAAGTISSTGTTSRWTRPSCPTRTTIMSSFDPGLNAMLES